jgi:hypothetical protein|tara:strand:+ start:2514 stop:2888 length:375 start_codon:yes stop_codon:yes gene_type:complete
MTLPPPWPTKKHPGHNRVGSPLANPILKPSSASTTSRSSHGTSNVSGLRSNCSAPQHRSAGAGNAMRMPTQDTSYMPGSMSSSYRNGTAMPVMSMVAHDRWPTTPAATLLPLADTTSCVTEWNT